MPTNRKQVKSGIRREWDDNVNQKWHELLYRCHALIYLANSIDGVDYALV